MHPSSTARNVAPWPHPYAGVLQALALAQANVAAHDAALARALAELGEIDLPPGAPDAQDRPRLLTMAPLYFAAALEQAGVLPAAEQIAALFASSAITQPLGPGTQSLATFWRSRRERLSAAERNAIFQRVFEQPHFDRLMQAVCTAIVAEADGRDMREDVALAATAQALGEFLIQRADAMAAMAARDIVDNLNAALSLLRDRQLQQAFGVQSLWLLIDVANSGAAQTHAQRFAEQGRNGQQVLAWLAAQDLAAPLGLDAARAEDGALMAAAQRWLLSLPQRAT